jgi:iron complex transport system permease protein
MDGRHRLPRQQSLGRGCSPAGLSLAGALFQAMLRDALATPYTLGISAGASLGAVVAIWLDWQQVAGLPAIWMASLSGAAIVLALVVGAALQQRRMSSFSLLLSGLAANSVCSALIIVIYGLVGSTKSFSISRWLIVGRSMPNVSTKLSGRAGRFGSVAGSQLELRPA